MEWKKARCSQNNLTSHRKAGGAGLVDIYDYFWAIRLNQTKHWFKPTDTPLWVDIQKALAPTKDLTLLLISDRWIPWNMKNLLPQCRYH